MITTEKILAALQNVQEPDLGKDLVTLNMIQDIEIKGNEVSFTVVLTTPACPMKDMMRTACENAIRLLVSKEAVVKVNFTAQTTSKRVDAGAILPQVKNIIAVFSGKGGVGKSTVAANLALALSQGGASVGLMDADIYGPSVPIMFGVRGERPLMEDVNGKGMILPLERFGIKLMSIGLLVDEKNAVVWRGPMASSAVKQFVSDVKWGSLDYLIIDMPPGTGDIHLTLLQTVPVTGSVIVTTPQDVALADAKKGIAMFGQAQLNVPLIGLVENMSYFTPAELPDNRYYIFGKQGGRRLADEYDIPFLGEIPLVQSIREGIRDKRSYLCVGLDTDPLLLPTSLKDKPDGVLLFNKAIIDATRSTCVAYKINTAFYESMGAQGWLIMEETVRYIGKEHFIIADAKRGDIGNTSRQYAAAFFSQLAFDSITVSPYMGEDSVKPFLSFPDKWAIVLGLTSNTGAADFELLDCEGTPLYEHVLRKVSSWGSPSNLMFVLGATQADSFIRIRSICPDHFFLVPGIGAQGGSLREISEKAMNKDVGLLVNASRAILYASSGEDFAAAAAKVAGNYQAEMATYL